VLQQYRGELTMLDARGGGGDSAGFGNGESFGQTSPMDRPRSSGAKPAQNFARDLDDEVPF